MAASASGRTKPGTIRYSNGSRFSGTDRNAAKSSVGTAGLPQQDRLGATFRSGGRRRFAEENLSRIGFFSGELITIPGHSIQSGNLIAGHLAARGSEQPAQPAPLPRALPRSLFDTPCPHSRSSRSHLPKPVPANGR